MGRWFHPALLLLCGSISGGLITAIYLTGLFGVSLPSTFELPAIPSGWGGVIGTLLTGAVAISLLECKGMLIKLIGIETTRIKTD